jgi:spore coat protein U-like protein
MIRRVALAAALVLLIPQAANAFTFSCNVNVNTLAFGAFSGLERSSQTLITQTCTGQGSDIHVITLSRGNSNTYFPRQMFSGFQRLNYNIYATPDHHVVWGDGSGGSGVVSILFTYFGPAPVTRALNAFGQLPAQPTPAPGHYTDRIVVTVSY